MRFFRKNRESFPGPVEKGAGNSGKLGISDRAILEYIEGARLSEKMLVNAEGDVTVIAGSVDARYMRTLCRMIEDRYGRYPNVTQVTPFEFDQVSQSISKRKSGTQQAEARRAGNDTVQYVLDTAIGSNASDVYLDIRGEAAALSFRIHGQVKKIQTMDADKARNVARGLFNKAVNAQWEEKTPCDTAFSHESGGRLYRVRVNSLPDTRGQSLSLRIRDPRFILPLAESGYSEHQVSLINRICKAPGGLILITGETNSGKSTTLAAMIDHKNSSEHGHILTIEDPIEFVHRSRQCLVTQREVHRHTHGFGEALRSALREDPDVILVGEMRDLETIRLALTAAETGHLVFGTLHTSSAAKTIDRIVDVFPAAEKDMVRAMLSESLRAVISQTLLKKRGGGRAAAHEIMIGTPAIRNLIRENRIAQMYSAIQTGQRFGMRTLDQDLAELLRRGVISHDVALQAAVNRDAMTNP